MSSTCDCTSSRVDVALVCGGRWHDFDYARLRILESLNRHDCARCSVHQDFSDIGEITGADTIIAYTCDVRPTIEESAMLTEWVRSGGRFLALHATNSAIDAPDLGGPRVFTTPDAMPDFSRLLGSRFLAHPKIAEVTIGIVQPEHPLVRGLKSFTTTDEVYISQLSDDLDVIMDVDISGPCPGFATEVSEIPARYPVLFSRVEGEGSVLSFTLGHCRGRFDLADLGVEDLGFVDRIAWAANEFRMIMGRCVDWAVHGSTYQFCMEAGNQ